MASGLLQDPEEAGSDLFPHPYDGCRGTRVVEVRYERAQPPSIASWLYPERHTIAGS